MAVTNKSTASSRSPALKQDIADVDDALEGLSAHRARTINAFASLIAGELQRAYEAYNDSRTIKQSFATWTMDRRPDECFSERADIFIKKTRRQLTFTDMQGLQNALEQALLARELIESSVDAEEIMQTIGEYLSVKS